jgi:two-component system osmolarity sensor histidine kinase EnvZ
MLSSVSHDLRTPLTRMKLALAMMEEGDEARELARDIREMERMIDEFLAFARDEAAEEATPVDAEALLAEIVDEMRRGGVSVQIRREGGADAVTPMRRGAVKRAVVNLVENAAAFGARVEIGLWVGQHAIEITVEDDGPGIPADAREAALKPFTRLDSARNQDRGGGVGLGLAIASDTARAHGGSLRLEDGARLGGLYARLRLPR